MAKQNLAKPVDRWQAAFLIIELRNSLVPSTEWEHKQQILPISLSSASQKVTQATSVSDRVWSVHFTLAADRLGGQPRADIRGLRRFVTHRTLPKI